MRLRRSEVRGDRWGDASRGTRGVCWMYVAPSGDQPTPQRREVSMHTGAGGRRAQWMSRPCCWTGSSGTGRPWPPSRGAAMCSRDAAWWSWTVSGTAPWRSATSPLLARGRWCVLARCVGHGNAGVRPGGGDSVLHPAGGDGHAAGDARDRASAAAPARNAAGWCAAVGAGGVAAARWAVRRNRGDAVRPHGGDAGRWDASRPPPPHPPRRGRRCAIADCWWSWC